MEDEKIKGSLMKVNVLKAAEKLVAAGYHEK